MSVSETFKGLTSKPAHAVSGIGERIGDLPKVSRWSLIALFIVSLYLLPWWPDVPVLGWLVDTPGTSFEGVITDKIVIYVLVALGLNVVVGLAGLLDLGYVGFYAVGAYTVGILS
ncbi:MAG: ABC transporter permease subunit, partial [Actinomycetota bacterium]